MKRGPTWSCVPFILILFTSSWAYLQVPEDATVCLGSVSNISCASTNAQTIFYIVNDTSVPSPALSGFSVSAPIPIGNVTLVTLTVQGTYIGISHILCRILLTNGTYVVSVSYLTVQGPPSIPSNLMAVATGTTLKLTWGAPLGNELLSLLYAVVFRTGNGSILFNRTLGELQVIISIPNTCDQYEATVMAYCGATSGYPSIRKFNAGICNTSQSSTTSPNAEPISPEEKNHDLCIPIATGFR
eukprot:Em0012g696a